MTVQKPESNAGASKSCQQDRHTARDHICVFHKPFDNLEDLETNRLQG